MAENIILGSGSLYFMANTTGTVPEDTAIEIADNLVGEISGGASLEYKPSVSEIMGDSGKIIRRFITKEEVTFKSGVLTWDLKNLERLTASGEITTVVETGVKTLKVGGNSTFTDYLIHFVHTFADGAKLKVTLIGNAVDGFTFQFQKDKETIIDSAFKALSQSDGTLVIIREFPAEEGI